MALHDYLTASARAHPARPAILEADGAQIRYAELAALVGRARDRLVASGVGPGDRVGLCVRKSVDTVAAILAVLQTGAAYVPVDPSAPAERSAGILADCGVRALFVEERLSEALLAQLGEHGAKPLAFALDAPAGGAALARCLDRLDLGGAPPATSPHGSKDSDVAYILYTSGSTGKPKGVTLTHAAAVAFVEWCDRELAPTEADRFSSHAPFHFDLSILDLYLPLKRGASVVVIPEDVGKEPAKLAPLIAERAITIWYSAPSILALLVQFGKLETLDLSRLRVVLFAGEVFPIVHLKALAQKLPAPRYFNLYGPTETNVCTSFELPRQIPAERNEPFPIGKVCDHLEGVLIDGDGREAAPGSEGELCIRGGNVMVGYWNRPDLTENAFIAVGDGAPYYRTGDIVVAEPDGNLIFRGRRDRMVKKRGYRIELGEIEAGLYRHPEVSEAAVVAHSDDVAGVRILAHLATRSGGKLSVIALKKFCNGVLPAYMIPDAFEFHPALPKTTTDKIDYQRLKALG